MAGLRDHQKGQTLNKRLDCLEAELKELHEKIIQKRLKKLQIPSEHLSSESLELFKQKCFPRNQVSNTNDDGRDWYSCLKSITRSIAQGRTDNRGSEAVRKIASLTDVTSLGTFSTLMPTTTDQESSALKSTLGVSAPDRELMAYHVNTTMKPVKSNSDYSAFEKNTYKGVTTSRSDGGISNYLSTSTFIPKAQNKSLQECKKTLLMENHRLKQQLTVSEGLYAEVSDLKKRLKEEMKKRLQAERKADDILLGSCLIKNTLSPHESNKLNTTPICEKRDASSTLDRVEDLTHHKTQTLVPVTKMKSEDLPAESRRSPIEKKYLEEREKRIELEGIVAQFQEDLARQKKECAQISVGQKLALALAEQFRSKYEKESKQDLSDEENYLVKALNDSNRECVKLQEELSVVRSRRDVTDSFKDRALKAEAEVKLLQKRIDQYKRQNPLEASAVQSVLEKHKQAYSELLMAKKCSEAEYKARCRSLEGEVARLHAYYEKRIKTLNVRIKELMVQLEEKLICIDQIAATKDNLDLVELRRTICEKDLQARQREAMIVSLSAIVADKESHTKQLENEKEEAVGKLKKIHEKIEDLQSELDNKNEEIGKLLLDIGLKSDEISIKGKILEDQAEKINSLRKTLNDAKKGSDESIRNREELIAEIKQLKEENSRLLKNVNEMAHTIVEAEKFKEGQEKNVFLLHQLEKQVYDRQKEWEFQLTNMSKEKDQAIQTAKRNSSSKIQSDDNVHIRPQNLQLPDDEARFATQKLVAAVGEYESQLNSHKQLQHLLKASLQEKDQKLQQAISELDRLNTEAAVAGQKAELMKRDFHTKLNDVCRVCSDVIDGYEDINSGYS